MSLDQPVCIWAESIFDSRQYRHYLFRCKVMIALELRYNDRRSLFLQSNLSLTVVLEVLYWSWSGSLLVSLSCSKLIIVRCASVRWRSVHSEYWKRRQISFPRYLFRSHFFATMLGTFLSPATTRMGSVCQRALATSTSASIMSFYNLSAVKGDGSVQSMEEFRGKVVYATNVASM